MDPKELIPKYGDEELGKLRKVAKRKQSLPIFLMWESVYKNLGAAHFSLQQSFKSRTGHGTSTRNACDLCGSRHVHFSSKAQEASYDQGCAGTTEPILDFWYVPGGSTLTSLEVGGLNAEIFKGTSGIS